jgi:hypothetical protein
MNEHVCSEAEQLGGVLDLPPDHPARRAAEACPRCQATLWAYRDFVAANIDTIANYTASDAQELDRRRTRLMRDVSVKRRPRLFAPVMLPAWGLAAAAVALVALQLRPADPRRSDALRGETTTLTTPSLHSLADGGLRFEWSDQQEVESFELQFLDAQLQTVRQLPIPDRTGVHLSGPEVHALRNRAARFWRVVGLAGGDVVHRSPLTALPGEAAAESSSAKP